MREFISQGITSVQGVTLYPERCLSHLLGIRMTAIGPRFIIGEMPVDDRTRQPYGLLHGGASMVLAETLGSYASVLLVNDEPGARVSGIEIGGSHVRAARHGKVVGTCRPVNIGRTIHFWQIDIHDDRGHLCCAARLTVHISRRATGNAAG